VFHSARIKLTAWYLLIIMTVSLTFSLAIYRGFAMEVERFDRLQRFRIERRFMEGEYMGQDGRMRRFEMVVPVVTDLVEEAKQRIMYLLIGINGGILVLAGGLGYLLAGRTLRPIQLMMAEQNRFVSDASHELKTPLTSLKCAFEVFLRDKKRTKAGTETLVNESIAEVDRLHILSESLLKLAAYQPVVDQPHFSKVALLEVIKAAVLKTAPLAKKKQVKITIEKGSLNVYGQAGSLTDLVVILLDNAIKYSPAHSRVKVAASRREGWVLLTVSDQGVGIKKKDLPYIFDRFYRADTARSKNQSDGYGLGLAIARKIARLHQGEITVKSTPGEGSEFTVRLPVRPVRPAERLSIFQQFFKLIG
jgi:two-component system, OmpR family, sensor histidine kinase CiaH